MAGRGRLGAPRRTLRRRRAPAGSLEYQAPGARRCATSHNGPSDRDAPPGASPRSKITRMPWIRRRARDAEPSSERLPDLEFLALVKTGLERYAPGVTEGTELRGNSLSSPH